MLGLEFRAMGCQMQVLADMNKSFVSEDLASIPSLFQLAEQRFSRFLTHSELMRLNLYRELSVSDEFWQMLQHSLASAKLTDGLVTSTVYQRLIQRGYDSSFDKLLTTETITANTSTHQTLTHESISDWQKIILHSDIKNGVTLVEDIKLDFGGFAKMLTAYDIASQFSQYDAKILIDAGGDIVTIGNEVSVEQPTWQINLPAVDDITLPCKQLQHTIKDIKTVAQTVSQFLKYWYKPHESRVINLAKNTNNFLATSGIDYRYWWSNQQLQHHLINPVSNYNSEVICASVLIDEKQFYQSNISPHPKIQRFLQVSNLCNLAQSISKLCCLLGVAKSIAWLEEHGLQQLGLSLVIITPNGYEQWLNPAMQNYCTNL